MFKHKEMNLLLRENKVEMTTIVEHRVIANKDIMILNKVLPG